MTKVDKNLESGNFDLVEAAGGVVRNLRGEVLMIFRRGVWDLPKGHREAGETWEQCALREVSEETGLPEKELECGAEIAVTYHTYTSVSGRAEKKQTRWFAMHYRGGRLPRPQTEEDIEAAAWIPVGRLAHTVADSYDTIKEVISRL